jgi:hypothetical protein
MSRPKPDTALLRLAAERGWRVRYFDDDGSGGVEIEPGALLDITCDPADEGGPPVWKVAVQFSARSIPGTADGLSSGIAKRLYEASMLILAATPEELAEVRQQARAGAA